MKSVDTPIIETTFTPAEKDKHADGTKTIHGPWSKIEAH